MAKTVDAKKIIEALPSLDEENLRQVVEAANSEKEKREIELKEKLNKLNGGK